MYTVIVILILIVCVLLAAVVLVQNSKGGGLAANFSAPNQIMGVRKTTEAIEKITWWLVGILVVLSLAATALIPRGGDDMALTPGVGVDAAKSVTAAPQTQQTAPMATEATVPEAE